MEHKRIWPKDVLTKEVLIEEYIVKKKSVGRIAKDLGLASSNSVCQYIEKYGLYRPRADRRSEVLTREFLYEEYVVKQRGMRDIAKDCGFVSKDAVRRHLKKYGIPIRESVVANEKIKAQWLAKRTGHEEITGRFWANIVSGAKSRELEFTITIEYIWGLFVAQNRMCALSGVEIGFYRPGERMTTCTASLDRIDSSLGYIEGNLQWIHKDLQKMKWTYSQEEFIRWARLVVKHADNVPEK